MGVHALSLLAGKGVNVIAVLHQPSYEIYKKFDDVMLLCPGGMTVYHGPSVDALAYFQGLGFKLPSLMNPADFFMDVIAGNVDIGESPEINTDNDFFVGKWAAEREKGASRKRSLPLAKPIGVEAYAIAGSATFAAQFYLFAKRATTQHVRKGQLFVMEIVLLIFIGLFIGNAYSSGNVSSVSNSSMMFGFGLTLGVGLVSLRVFGAELLVYWREAAPGAGMELSKLAFFLARNVVELPRILVLTLVCCLQFYPAAKPLCGAGNFFLQSFFVAWNGAGLAMVLSVAFDIKVAQLCYVVACLIFLLEAGVFTLLKSMSMFETVLSWISPMRWFVEGITTCSIAELGPGTRLPASWYGVKSDSAFVLLRSLWFSEALFNPPAPGDSTRRTAAMFSERYAAYSNTNNTGFEMPMDYPKIQINVLMNLTWGTIWRIIAFACLSYFNRSKMGEREWSEILKTEVLKPLWKKYVGNRCSRKAQRPKSDLNKEGD